MPHINFKIISGRAHEICKIITVAVLELMPLEIHILSQLKNVFNSNNPIKAMQLLYGRNLNYGLIFFNEVMTC